MSNPDFPKRIYLDHNATTPLREEVVESMLEVLRGNFGNPSSIYEEGARARRAIEEARERVANSLGASPREITFTAGATESNNTVLFGVGNDRESPPRIVSTTGEHPSVLAPLEALRQRGSQVVSCALDADGRLDLVAFEEALEPGADLVSVLWGNNETGVIQRIDEIAALLKSHEIPLHVDATQVLGKTPIDLQQLPVDYLSCSAHKLNGPKGTGCLYVRAGAVSAPLLHGGPQERRFRGGTENVAGIVGFGWACELVEQELPGRMKRYRELRDRLWHGIRKSIPDVRFNGRAEEVLCNTLNIEFCGTAGDVLLQSLELEGVSASAGAACHSGSITPSHVLTAMGRSPEEARGTVRFSVGHGTEADDIDRVVTILADLVRKIRASELV